ncbi:hypothetical protein ASG25_00430 [Rhizobium sp. Leaf384]|uniref:hypothetical protein n=1 Tax=unclassified Rhizobium TaxID=2613769 RepID=UPI000715B7D6|nr:MULTISPECIES: hypothetical protein [unclassified Rhizobium]KQR67897.1 hypothetical protein ASG03_10275 [Rhizobium sp. Leaf341]KQS74413.1 hypothetical protein ASG58_15625 [Rhizobium sp. Leaf383]KQS80152.1 hypothetical protein ASG25_00430 [Rhizobium sp. Leaf384]
MISWFAIAASLLAAAYIYQRMKRQQADDLSTPDEGQAILDFGRAFPDEAIRAIHPTADGNAFFVRLHDGKAGIVLGQGRHYLCHLIVPGKVRITHAASGRGLGLSFSDTAIFDGTYEFATGETAAEVSLWILGSFSA